MDSRSLFGTVVCAILVLATSSPAALGQNDPAADRLLTGNGDDSPPTFSETMADPSQGGPRWTATADFILLDRIGGANQTLVETLPRSVKYDEIRTTPGTPVLNGNDFQQGFGGGPSIDLIRHGNGGYDLELSYFQIDGCTGNRTIGPVDPRAEWLVMRAPGGYPTGGFIQTNQDPVTPQAMIWDYGSQLYNAECNVRWNPSGPVTVLAGFRWVNLSESLLGALEPPFVPREIPFWNATTSNNLYGFQIGADGKLLQRGRFSIEGLVKAGLFDNDAEETTIVSIHKLPLTASASTNHAAFAGQTGLQCKYQLAKGLVLRVGYEAIWLQGVALAPGQIQETYINTHFVHSTVQALGVNCNSGAFYHGATTGLEYSF